MAGFGYPAQTPAVDLKTGRFSREWDLFMQSVYAQIDASSGGPSNAALQTQINNLNILLAATNAALEDNRINDAMAVDSVAFMEHIVSKIQHLETLESFSDATVNYQAEIESLKVEAAFA